MKKKKEAFQQKRWKLFLQFKFIKYIRKYETLAKIQEMRNILQDKVIASKTTQGINSSYFKHTNTTL